MKMNPDQQNATEAAESSGFAALPAGRYVARLDEVKFKESSKGDPGWNWVWKVVSGPGDETKYKGRLLFTYTTLNENMAFKRKEIFEALDFELETDTDDMLGALVVLDVSERPNQGGSRKGEMGNNVDKHLLFDGDESSTEEDEDDWVSS